MKIFSRNVLITLAVTDSVIMVLLLVVIFVLLVLLRRAKKASKMQAEMNAKMARDAPVHRNNGFIAPSVAFSAENKCVVKENTEDEDGYMVPKVKADKDEEHIYDDPIEILQGNDPKKDDEEYIYNDPSELFVKKKKDVKDV